jgi:GT2 family glycosyltransferase
MDLSIIIVTYNVRDLTRKCLASIYKYTQNIDFEVFVVDNASKDGTVEMIKKEFKAVNLIALSKNTGFAYANNLAIKKAHGNNILFLNPDTEMASNVLETIVRENDAHDDWGVVGTKILNLDGSIQSSVRRFPGLIDQIFIQLKLHNISFFKKFLKSYLMSDFDYSKKSQVDQVMGAFFLTKKSVLDKVGLFDQKYYLWFEEVDLCKRIKDAGLKIVYTPKIEIFHHGGESFKQLNWHKQLIWNHSAHRYFWLHKPKWQWAVLWLFQPISLLFAVIVYYWKK